MTWKDAFSRRGAALGGVAAVALVASFHEGSAADAKELALLLATEAGGLSVREADLRWEPSGGAVSDWLSGRWLLFLGSTQPDGPRDVYRTRVRLSPEGKVIGIGAVYNLTSTPIGDDHALVVNGTKAAYATWAYGKETSVTALDLAGEGTQATAVKLSDRVMTKVTNIQQTGSEHGIARFDVTFETPADRVGLTLTENALLIDVADDPSATAAQRHASLDLTTGEMTDVPGMRAEAGKHLPKQLVHWAVDTVRAVPWIGPAPIAWLEEKTFALRDEAHKAMFKMKSDDSALAKEADAPIVAAILDTSEASMDLGHWPPPAIKSMWKTPEAGEGEWKTPRQTWAKKIAEQAPSAFYETFVRVDEERPYAKILLVAMDMRQLDLGMEAGSEDPKPLTGPPGVGRVPRDPNVYPRIAACFNGGFKTEHGNYGMMLNKRVLLPPQPGAASVILTKDGRVGMGSWGSNTTIGGITDIEKDDIVSMRQNLDPLVDSDKVNPSNRGQWGFVLPGTSMQTERTGLCVTNAGHLIYAWGEETSATSLGKAMKAAGCVYGMHLDMNPHHTGFMYTTINAFKGKDYKSELLTSKMGIDTDRYLLYAPKDFFFMTVHDPKPPALEGVTWEADPGTQPAPSFMPGLWRGLHGTTQILDIEPARASFRIRAGTKDGASAERGDSPKKKKHSDDEETPKKKELPPGTELSTDDAHRVLFALTLGISKDGAGLAADGQVIAKPRSDEKSAMLSVSEDGAIAIASTKDFTLPSKGDAVELPLVMDDGKAVGSHDVQVALGVTPAGRVLVARGGDVVAALKLAGVTRAVSLNRGAGEHGKMFRAGTDTPPRSHYEDSTLYAMGKPLLPRGFKFEPSSPVEAEKPKKK
ncbi:MAG: hypothetical protein U0270_14200 [Labilithrix sp.]